MAPVIAALCNQAYQLEVLSTGPDLLVRLSARSPNPGQGFKATFEFESTSDSDDLQHLDPKQSGNTKKESNRKILAAKINFCNRKVPNF
jgi:hypothetical protein